MSTKAPFVIIENARVPSDSHRPRATAVIHPALDPHGILTPVAVLLAPHMSHETIGDPVNGRSKPRLTTRTLVAFDYPGRVSS